MRLIFRFLLILILLYVAARLLAPLFRPQRRKPIEPDPAAGAKKIDEQRIQDATFKDLPEE